MAELVIRLAGWILLFSRASWALHAIGTIVAWSAIADPPPGKWFGGFPWTGLKPLYFTAAGELGVVLVALSRLLHRWAHADSRSRGAEERAPTDLPRDPSPPRPRSGSDYPNRTL